MTKVIASVLILSFAFMTGVVLGARNSQPEVKKIAVLKTEPKEIEALALDKSMLAKGAHPKAQKPDISKLAVMKKPFVKANKFLNKKRTGYTVLLSSFKVEENANNYAQKIASKGYDAFYFSKEIKGKTWHRVGVGSFSSISTAKSLKKQLTENRLGKGSLITKIPRGKSI